MTDSLDSQSISPRRFPEVMHQHGIWRRTSPSNRSFRRFSFTQQEIDHSAAVKVYREDRLIDNASVDSGEFVLPSPPMSVWSFAMSSSDGQISEDFALCDPKNLKYHRDRSTVTPSVRQSINSTNADYDFSVATSSGSESSFSYLEEEICSELLSMVSDIPREIIVQKSFSQRFPLLKRLARKLFRQTDNKLEL